MPRQDHLGLLCDVSELLSLLAGSRDVRGFLFRLVRLVAERLHADVCSLYLYDEDTDELVLKATRGLNPEAVDRLRLGLHEGLVGRALREATPVRVDEASRTPQFKPVEGLNEERYECFLAVPVLRGEERVGVLVLQREARHDFAEADLTALRAVAAQLAGAIENARVLMLLEEREESERGAGVSPAAPNGTALLRGEVASPGTAHGPLCILRPDADWSEGVDEPTGEEGIARLGGALEATARQLADLQERLEDRLPEVAGLIFAAHVMILKDAHFLEAVETGIREGRAPSLTVRAVAERYMERLRASPQPYLREKAQDVEDVARRLARNLVQPEGEALSAIEGGVVAARELYPSDILRLSLDGAAGVLLVQGGVTSHVVLLARSLSLPVALLPAEGPLHAAPGTPVLLDGGTGNVYLRPSPEIVARFREHAAARAAVEARPPSPPAEGTRTADGTRVKMLANINLLSELALARDLHAEGIGLYRTEFPFLIRSHLPSEEEQVLVYRRLFDGARGREVTVRTLDVGGDKLLAAAEPRAEENPALGLRSIRFSLRHPAMFRQQVRAILRAGAEHETLRIMFPMVSSLEEFRAGRAVVAESLAALGREGAAHHAAPSVGMMIEVPSVLELLDAFAAEADFFSIGTNDFVQFLLAVDRGNEAVAPYYRPDHPAVLRALRRIVEAAARRGREVSLCGEMAHDPEALPLLLGIGVRTLSADPRYLPLMRETLAGLRLDAAERLARSRLDDPALPGSPPWRRDDASAPVSETPTGAAPELPLAPERENG